MTSLSLVQSALNSSAREFNFDRIIRVLHRYFISVKTRCLGSIRFFLVNVVQPISLTEAFQLGTKGKNWNLNEVKAARCGGCPRCSDCRLIIAFAHVAVLFQRRVVSHNHRSNLSTEAEVNYVPCSLIQIIIDLIFAPIRQLSQNLQNFLLR